MVAPAPRDERIDQIRRAAVDVFASHGFRGTSMALIAEAVGVSRPALYQYFASRQDVFRASMELVLDEAAARALGALTSSPDLPGALAGWLRHGYADRYASVAGLAHGAELLEAHHEFSVDIAERALSRMRNGLEHHLRGLPDLQPADVEAALQLLTLSPIGLKSDSPTPAVYAQRLARLGQAVTAMLER